MYKRIVLKLSGESLSNENNTGIDFNKALNIANDLKKIYEEGIHLLLVIGGGNFWRGRDGQIIKNRDEDAVGVYIVESRDEKIGEINVEKEIEDIEREDIEWCKQFIEGKIQWSRGNNSGENVETEKIR